MSASTRFDVSRLLARVAFGATQAQLDEWTGRPYEELVEFLLAVPPPNERIDFPDVGRLVNDTFDTTFTTIEGAQRWWLDRMRTTQYPLEERMTLFLHDHFATGFSGDLPNASMLLAQNDLLRRHSLGSFKTLCEAITIDPAMLYWLDGNVNTAMNPNENYARELFELFTLGVSPKIYTEDDVREAARVLTGWYVNFDNQPAFDPAGHDTGAKQVLGHVIYDQGDKEYLSLVDLALAQDVASLFIAYKLVVSFAYVPSTTNLTRPDPLVAKVAAALRSSRWDLRVAMRVLMLADEFRYADVRTGRQVVRQPIELVVHGAKALEIGLDNAMVLNLLGRMGQKPFQPPNVGGWPKGKAWLSVATAVARYDWGVVAHEIWQGDLNPFRALPASNDLDGWAARFGLSELTPNTRDALVGYLAARAGADEIELQGGIAILLASSPDWGVS